MIDFSKRGSEWRQCDLHIHTPFSAKTEYGDQNNKKTWDDFITDIRSSYDKGAILGINDYNSFDGYFKIIQDYPEILNDYILFPVIEFRTDDYVGKTAQQKINLHVIFSNTVSENDLKSLLDTPLTLDGVKVKDIKDFANKPISIKELHSFFSKHRNYYEGKYLFMLGRNEAGELDNEIKSSFMTWVDFICSASEGEEQAKKAYKDTLEHYGLYNIKYVHCSDAHLFSSNTKEQTRKIGHCYTWIKGQPCFETLRQAYFSYDTRIRIAKNKPSHAVNVLDKVKISLPKEASIGDNDCCFSGKSIEFYLNPSLNCIIGGRGTGKSFLLQLLCKNNKDSLEELGEKCIVEKLMPKNWDEFVEIDGIEFEYFGQGTIERLYENEDSFNESISSRLNKFWSSESCVADGIPIIQGINNAKQELNEAVASINSQITLLSRKVENDVNIELIQKEVVACKKIIEAFQDDEYKALSLNLSNITNKVAFIEDAKKSFNSLLQKTTDLILELEPIEIDGYEDVRYYADLYNSLLSSVNELNSGYSKGSSQDWVKKETELGFDLKTADDAIRKYFDNRGMSKANIDDAAKAQIELDALNIRLAKLKVDNKRPENDLVSMRESVILADKKYLSTMSQALKNAEEIIRSKDSGEANLLTFECIYNTSRMLDDICYFLKTKANVDKSDFEAILRRRNEEERKKDITSAILHELCRKNQDLKSCLKIAAFFEENANNKNIYDLVYLSCKYNSAKYELFSVLYKGKKLKDLSFGQRATAVVLTMLLFGNKPLIIDEPETHLDQSFVALELVEVIKRTKMDKQIIFATHNANIVINGDAEQIFILKTETDNKTRLEHMSIEEVYEENKRADLLMLEGSAEAFKLRERKYLL